MIKLIDIISPIYQDLLKKCERRKISVNLDINNLTTKIEDEDLLNKFYQTEIKRAFKSCAEGDKITLSQIGNRYSVKYSAKTPLSQEEIATLREKGYEVRARFGYDTIITLVLSD